VLYYDSKMQGFAIRIAESGRRTWIAYSRVKGGAPCMYSIGPFPAVKADDARETARTALGKMATGTDPNREKAQAGIKRDGLGLEAVFNGFLKSRGKKLKARTLKDYERDRDRRFSAWANTPVTDLTRDMIEAEHKRQTEAHGKAQADQSFRALRAVLNWAGDKYLDDEGHSLIPENPVRRLSTGKHWHNVARRRTRLQEHEIKPWWGAVAALENGTARDYLQFVLLTGLRSTESRTLRWKDVDLKARTFTIPDPKNSEPHTLPLSDFLLDMLTRRKDSAVNGYVFPGEGEHGHLIEPRKQMAKADKATGKHIALHDLRRTFASVAESIDLSAYSLKRLLNHKSGSDVTEGYLILDVERLREPMQRITDKFLTLADVKPGARIIPMTRREA
jgi:integrase